MAQKVKGLANKPQKLGSVPGSNDGRKKKLTQQLSSEIHVHCGMCMPAFPHAHVYIHANTNIHTSI